MKKEAYLYAPGDEVQIEGKKKIVSGVRMRHDANFGRVVTMSFEDGSSQEFLTKENIPIEKCGHLVGKRIASLQYAFAFIFLIFLASNAVAEPLSAHFKREEFNQRNAPLSLSQVKVEKELVERLEILRKLAGNRSIKVLSGFRTPEYNARVGGVPGSQHTLGKAADVQIYPLTPAQVKKLAKEAGFRFIKQYPWGVHVDVRK